MKMFALIILGLIVSYCSFADIINGYEKDLKKAEQSLLNLTNLLDKVSNSNSDEQYYRIKSHYQRAKQSLKVVRTFHSMTADLINTLWTRHPSFCDQINNIRNHNGLVTDIYISVIPKDRMKRNQFGTTNLDQTKDDPHTYQSSFGPNTVSVQIRECSDEQMIQLLIHELGHVKYQVPNLSAYMDYFHTTYQHFRATDSFGHKKDDPSNLSVQKEMGLYQESMKRKRKPGSALDLTASNL